jgi:alkylated DNA repair dioxygenase AlkB
MIHSEIIKLEDGNLIYFPNFIDQSESLLLFNFLSEEIAFDQHQITIFGKTFSTPRLESFHAKENRSYSYSGIKLQSKPFNQKLHLLCDKVEKATNSIFNSVLINLYRNGMDSNGWHADNEKELGENPVIASLSFGASRRFDLKHNTTQKKCSIDLNSGDLLWMDGNIQNFYKHQVAKTKRVDCPRINLTFRYLN